MTVLALIPSPLRRMIHQIARRLVACSGITPRAGVRVEAAT